MVLRRRSFCLPPHVIWFFSTLPTKNRVIPPPPAPAPAPVPDANMAAARPVTRVRSRRRGKQFSPLDETTRKKVDRCIGIRCILGFRTQGNCLSSNLLTSHLDLCKLEPGLCDALCYCYCLAQMMLHTTEIENFLNIPGRMINLNLDTQITLYSDLLLELQVPILYLSPTRVKL